MPLTFTLTEGVLPAGAEKEAVARITDAFLRHHGMPGNKVMTPNITAHVNILPKGQTFSGGKEVEGAWIEFKSPSFALANRNVQVSFFREATQIVHDLSGKKLPKERIRSNGVHAVDGTWNFNGVAVTNAELGEAAARG